jgi:dihydrofolate synthase / folylpolyglutamate synthase
MSYETAIDRMYALGHELALAPAHKFDLQHMRVLLAALDHPERRFPGVLIAGTNGKGSTSATLASILRASGLRTALYTSPHLVAMNERIQINGEPISDDDFSSLHDVVDRAAERLLEEGELPWHPSFFEMLTAIAFEYFAKNHVEIAVLEVGMGGRLDATNVVDPVLSVITDISLDHQRFLGDTVAAIAREKAGIIRPHGIVVTLPQLPAANDAIGSAVLDCGAVVVSAVPYVPPVSPASPRYFEVGHAGETAGLEDGPFPPQESSALKLPTGDAMPTERSTAPFVARYPLQVMGERILVETPLMGRHQLRNIALAIASADELSKKGFPITPGSVERGIRQTRWPARFQVIPASAGAPEYVLDVAHNPAGAWALRSTLSACYEGRSLTLVFGAMRDKAIAEMAEILFPLAARVIATHAENPRSATPEEIRQLASRISAEIDPASSLSTALDRARSITPRDGIIVITGSIYIVGGAMRILGLRI